MHDPLLDELEQVLETERTALLTAQYGALEQIGQDKARLVALMAQAAPTLAAQTLAAPALAAPALAAPALAAPALAAPALAAPTRARADRVLARMRHNQALVGAALSGLRGVWPVTAAAGFQSYGEDGRRAALTLQRPGFERRA